MDHLSKINKILIGIASFWPIIYISLFFLMILSFMIFGIYMDSQGHKEINQPMGLFFVFIVLGILSIHLFTIFLIIGLQIFYLIHLIHTERIGKNIKTLWVILLVLFGFIIFPIYWYINLWREPDI